MGQVWDKPAKKMLGEWDSSGTSPVKANGYNPLVRPKQFGTIWDSFGTVGHLRTLN